MSGAPNSVQSGLPYRYLAPYYDKLMHDCDYAQWSQYLYELIAGLGLAKGHGADGGCGSGKMTLLLSKKGLDLFGFDSSPAMLAEAAEAARQAGRGITFVQADIRSFKAHRKLSFITCSCDAVNYIAPENRQSAFKHCCGQLKPGGALLFDVSSAHKLGTVLPGQVSFEDGESVTALWTSALCPDGNAAALELTLFVLEKDGRYRRHDERHIQYIHRTSEVLSDLRKAGFTRAEAYGFGGRDAPKPQDMRIQFLAVK